jgi:hypothetical protein
MLALAVPAAAYTPQVFNPATATGQNFITSSKFDTTVWTHQYGGGYWFPNNGTDPLLLDMANYTSTPWTNTAIMQTPDGCSKGFGYGDFHWRAGIPAANANQQPGVNLILWRMDNQWITAALGHIVTEDDIMEAWSANGTGDATLHYYNTAASPNGQNITGLGLVTGLHDYDELWLAGSLVLKIDGVVIRALTGSQVPTDYKHGGCNYSLGAQVIKPNGYTMQGLPTVQLQLANMWWSASDGSGGATASTGNVGTISPPVIPAVTTGVSWNLTASYAYTSGTPGSIKLIVDGTVGPAQAASLAGNQLTVAGPTTLSAGNHSIAIEDAVTSRIVSTTETFAVSTRIPVNTQLTITGVDYSSLNMLTLSIKKATGSQGTLLYKDNGAYLGVLRGDANDGSMTLHWLYSTAPSRGVHTATVYIPRGGPSVTTTFTVP